MDGQTFDAMIKRLVQPVTRRGVLRILFGGSAGLLAGAAGVDRIRAANDASQFCNHLPPGKRGRCRTDAANGDPGGLFAQCEGDPDHLCGAADGSFTCCTSLQTCGGGGTPGACGCTPTKTTCAPGDCGRIPDGCGRELDCGDTCPSLDPCLFPVCDAGQCRYAPLSGKPCGQFGTGTCDDGRCVGACAPLGESCAAEECCDDAAT